jgi:hypothetical protein
MCFIPIYSKLKTITTWKLRHTHWMVTMSTWITIKHNLNENNFLQFVDTMKGNENNGKDIVCN